MRQWTYLKFSRVLRANGYSIARCSGDHNIFKNSKGYHISVPVHLVSVIANRLIKENNLKLDL